jgi:hypothetical protein
MVKPVAFFLENFLPVKQNHVLSLDCRHVKKKKKGHKTPFAVHVEKKR